SSLIQIPLRLMQRGIFYAENREEEDAGWPLKFNFHLNLMIYYSLKEIPTNYPNTFCSIEQLFHLYSLEKNGYS
ncbi:MAG: hypothetical protein RSE18_18000, partial [Acinetobacter sp.]